MEIIDNRKEIVPLTHIEQGEFFEKDNQIFLKIYGGVYNRQEEINVFCMSTKIVHPMSVQAKVTPLPHTKIVIDK